MACRSEKPTGGNTVGGVGWAGANNLIKIELFKTPMKRIGSAGALSNALSGGLGQGSSGQGGSLGMSKSSSGFFGGNFFSKTPPGN